MCGAVELESPGVVGGDGVSRQKLRNRLSDGLGTLDLQEMAHPVDRALLDVRERGAEERGDLHPQRLGLAPITDRTGLRMAAACSGPNVHSVRAGSSTPKKVSASLIDCVTTPGIRSSSNARHVSQSRPLAAAHEHGKRARVVAASVCLEHRAGGFKNAAPRGNDTSVGSSRVSVCTFSGWSRASWAPIDAPVEWPAMCARRTPRWSSNAAASAACSAMLTGGGVCVLPTQPRLWYRISW